jgi:hypothetical protein
MTRPVGILSIIETDYSERCFVDRTRSVSEMDFHIFINFRGNLASWNLEFCSSCVVLLRNVQVPRRNSDSHLVFCDPTQLRAKKRI